ncbi:Non-specific serine/threonine protein kinase protein [Dioscorea alata]|uniref:Non-specific serine/threonine protein kinase protein n=1 Tax=Dioscorea alata TaxID=55571 RepID=A0ACB7UP07_DIOAL|nr:Non-specific serine/threonine protein kinase protein [Dioscorea alata]
MLCLTETLLLLLLSSLVASPALSDTVYQSCDTSGNYTTNSTFQSNLFTLLPSLSSNGSASGFYTNTVGTVPDKIYGLVLCRGDTNATACHNCLDVARQDVIQICSNNKGGLVWYDPCYLRYSNQNFLSSTDNSNAPILYNTQNVSDPDKFNKLLVDLMNKIAQFASYNTSRRFATGEANFTVSNPKIYGLTQCTPDLSGDQCHRCLQAAFNAISGLPYSQGLRVLGVRCNFRYELYPFYEGKSMVLLSASSPQSNGTNTTTTPTVEEEGKKNNTGIILAISIPLVIAVLIISTICFCFWKRRRLSKKNPSLTESEEITDVESILFDLSMLRDATANFSDENKLGEGGFGAVYKGLLHDGREIAVKRLSRGSGQGIGELKNELVLVAKLQHRNLVRLLGVCLEEQEKILVYEYVPNRSLDTILFDSVKRKELDWERRYKIINGIARGLLYLHEDSQLKIIHRDLKASNILLDEDMNPKISDFGLARLFGGDQIGGTTSRVVGTL